jgi:hypothetical protein
VKTLKLLLHLVNPKRLPTFPKKVQKVEAPKSKLSNLLVRGFLTSDTFRLGDLLAGNDDNIYRQMSRI